MSTPLPTTILPMNLFSPQRHRGTEPKGLFSPPPCLSASVVKTLCGSSSVSSSERNRGLSMNLSLSSVGRSLRRAPQSRIGALGDRALPARPGSSSVCSSEWHWGLPTLRVLRGEPSTFASLLAVALLCLLALPRPASAAVPIPDHLIYGTIAIDGRPVTRADSTVTIEARRTSNGPILASYRMGSRAALGDFYYTLRIPVAQAADASPTRAALGLKQAC
jgi:hypothetical protein